MVLLTRVFFLAALHAGLGCAFAGQPFAIQVIDGSSQRGVPMVALETDNHVRFVTDSAGWVAFDEPAMMGRAVHFAATSPGYQLPKDGSGQPGMVLQVHAGQMVEVRLVRTCIAERLYRLTGQGIYRDTMLLGREAPLPFPNLDGDVISERTVQSAPYQGKLFWLWGETRRMTPRCRPFIAGAVSDLPGAGGLDPIQGVHLRYLTNEQEEPLSLLTPPAAMPDTVQTWLEGLVSVKDRAGAEHLLAHYSLTKDDGTRIEHGIAEFNDQHTFDRKTVLGEEYTWQFPHGNAVEVKDDDGDFIYFAAPLCHVRVTASYDALLSPTSYEALAWSDDDEKLEWQQSREPLTQAVEARLIQQRKFTASGARCQLVDAVTEKPVAIQDGSVEWSVSRKCWIMIARGVVEEASSGDVWYAEASRVTGPWSKAVQVATHGGGMSFSSVMQHAALVQESGRFIYFEGTCFRPADPLPRYEGNSLMYRLDLNDERLAPARHH